MIDFAWIVLIGLQIGYSEKEVGRMYFGKWYDLFCEYKKLHNLRMKRCLFPEEKRQVSMIDI